MSAYLEEEEQIEAIRNWWKENGRSVIAGAVLGLAAIFGWQGWHCLLYTSPSPRDDNRSRMPSSA